MNMYENANQNVSVEDTYEHVNKYVSVEDLYQNVLSYFTGNPDVNRIIVHFWMEPNLRAIATITRSQRWCLPKNLRTHLSKLSVELYAIVAR